MKFTIKRTERSLKEGNILEITQPTVIFGNNGCGKTTFVNALRGKFFKGHGDQDLDHIDNKALKDWVEVEMVEQTKFVFYSQREDDPSHVMVDASVWMQKGGMATRYKSKGQSTMLLLKNKLAEAIDEMEKGNPVCVVMDEADSGFDVANQKLIANGLRNLKRMYGNKFNVLYFTHSLIVMNELRMNGWPIFNFENWQFEKELPYDTSDLKWKVYFNGMQIASFLFEKMAIEFKEKYHGKFDNLEIVKV